MQLYRYMLMEFTRVVLHPLNRQVISRQSESHDDY